MLIVSARDGGLRKLRNELGVENSRMHSSAEIRWLGGVKVRACFQVYRDGSSSLVAALLGEVTFCPLDRARVRLFRRRYEVGPFGKAGRSDAFCSQCNG